MKLHELDNTKIPIPSRDSITTAVSKLSDINNAAEILSSFKLHIADLLSSDPIYTIVSDEGSDTHCPDILLHPWNDQYFTIHLPEDFEYWDHTLSDETKIHLRYTSLWIMGVLQFNGFEIDISWEL